MVCRICGGATTSWCILHSKRHALDVPVWSCPACRCFFSDGGPTSYDDADLTGYYAAHADRIKARYERMYAFFETLVAPARLVDVGAGMGYSIEVAERRGWKAEGIEPNASLVRSATHRGLRMRHGYLDSDTPGRFELVLADNVLEHVPDPKAFLADAARLLAPGGLLVVAIPPLDWLRRALGSFAFVRDKIARPQINVFSEVDEHLHMLGRIAMTRLVRSVGLVVEPTRFHHSSLMRQPIVRACGIDDGYYFIRRSDADPIW